MTHSVLKYTFHFTYAFHFIYIRHFCLYHICEIDNKYQLCISQFPLQRRQQFFVN
uniref:Uncharacterized protein n=1 Tax=Anguilla anguilla TaxID=7936 RepID=A0A0E9TVB6_ANGAN